MVNPRSYSPSRRKQGSRKHRSHTRIEAVRQRLRQRPQSMSREAAKVAGALDQLREGVPLNWSQMEDDPELVTLARLYPLAKEAHSQALDALPANLRSNVEARVAKRLPTAKATALVKQTPTTLAGFSERVQVLTQVEDDIRPSGIPQWIAATVGAGLVVMLVAILLGRFFGPPTGPYTWIELRQGHKVVAAASLPGDYKAPNCPMWEPTSVAPYIFRSYMPMNGYQNMQSNVDFPIEYLPNYVTASVPFTTTLLDTAVAPCSESGTAAYSSAELHYSIYYVTLDGLGLAAPVNIFEGSRQVVTLDTAGATWKQVTVGQFQGVLWTGSRYRDQSDSIWADPVMILVLENQAVTTMMVVQANNYITEDMLLKMASQLTTITPDQQPTPTTQPIQPIQPTPAATGTPGATMNFQHNTGGTDVK